MKNDFYESRREQIVALVKDEKLRGLTLAREAAICGACGERDRTLEILRRRGLQEVAEEICSQAILEVLGFPRKEKKRASV